MNQGNAATAPTIEALFRRLSSIVLKNLLLSPSQRCSNRASSTLDLTRFRSRTPLEIDPFRTRIQHISLSRLFAGEPCLPPSFPSLDYGRAMVLLVSLHKMTKMKNIDPQLGPGFSRGYTISRCGAASHRTMAFAGRFGTTMELAQRDAQAEGVWGCVICFGDR